VDESTLVSKIFAEIFSLPISSMPREDGSSEQEIIKVDIKSIAIEKIKLNFKK